jgi:hypothetical protein
MAGVREIVLSIVALGVVLFAIYLIDPSFGGLLSNKHGFTSTLSGSPLDSSDPGSHAMSGGNSMNALGKNPHVAGGSEGFADGGMEGPASFGDSQKPEGCYPRDQLTPGELLPKDGNSVWAQQNPMGGGSLKGKNFLSAGALIGINTVGQSMRNANYQLRSEPPNPQVAVSVFNQSTIEPDTNRRSLEIS